MVSVARNRWLIGMSLSVALVGCVGSGQKVPPPAPPGSGATTPPPASWPPGGTNKPAGMAPPPGSGTKTSRESDAASGLLAGQVLDRLNRRPAGAAIQVVDLQEVPANSGGARVEVMADAKGYFIIQGLKPGCSYQLVARQKDGTRLYSGTVVARAPDPRLTIFIAEDLSGTETPQPPEPTALPDRSAPIKPPQATLQTPQPAATPPADSAPAPIQPVTPAPAPRSPAPSGASSASLRPELITRDDKLVMNNPVLSIPASGGPSIDLPGVSATPPSCVLVGNRLESLVLRDTNGNPWNFKSDRRGKLVLFDFWYSDCMPCMRSVPHMNTLQSMYERFGLQVVGLAYEQGSFDEQVARVKDTQRRKGMTYISLIGGGNSCPVRQQFDVHSFPSLVLVDENGQIIWRSPKGQGVSMESLREAEVVIRRGLKLPSR